MRQASEVILELEAKVDFLITLLKSLDLNTKINSNKLNSLNDKILVLEEILRGQHKLSSSTPKIEVVEKTSEQQFQNLPETIVTMDNKPQGFRRGTRSEVYAGDDAILNRNSDSSTTKFPVQIPKNIQAEIVVPPSATKKNIAESNEIKNVVNTSDHSKNDVQVLQRVVDRNGKSVFLADIEIINKSNMQSFPKVRSNAAGKWMSTLPIGDYKIFVRRRDPVSQEKLEIIQDIKIEGGKSPLELSTIKLP